MDKKAPSNADDPNVSDTLDNWNDDVSSSDDEVTKSAVNGDVTDTKSNVKENSENGDSDDDHDDDDTHEGYESKILNAYRNLLSRRVDLVGDYAGNELFLIDGDSLLLRCFSDRKLDFDPGFQMLHAAYNVELFLHQLVKRKCNFRLVFFESSKNLCIPPTASSSNAVKYLLARAAIIRHLQINLEDGCSIRVEEFSSYQSKEFAKYLKDASPYFIMAHDGASPIDRMKKHMSETQEDAQPVTQRLALREMILSFVDGGHNVALVNGLEWRDTKVMTMVLEPRRRRQLPQIQQHPVPEKPTNPMIDIGSVLDKLGDTKSQLSMRQLLAVIVVSKLLQDPSNETDPKHLVNLSSSFLQHMSLIAHLPLSARRLASRELTQEAHDYLTALSSHAEVILSNSSWRESLRKSSDNCDISDFIDGRVFSRVLTDPIQMTSETSKTYERLVDVVKVLGGFEVNVSQASSSDQSSLPNGNGASAPQTNDLAVLPFSNPVFDKHLSHVRLQIDKTAMAYESMSSHKIFKELTHWHNAKKPLVQRGQPTPASAKAAFWADKRNKLFMAEMQKYAASLTNAVGRSLEPETIIVGSSGRPANPSDTSKARRNQTSTESDSNDSSASTSKQKPQQKKGGGGKTAAKNAGKQAMLDQIAANRVKKEDSFGDKVSNSWTSVCKAIDGDHRPSSKYEKAKEYLINLQSTWRDVIGAEVELYMADCLVQCWIEACRKNERSRHIELTSLIWSRVGSICRSKNLTKEIISSVQTIVTELDLPTIPMPSSDGLPKRKMAFQNSLPNKGSSLSIDMDSKEYQLDHCGPYLERSFDSAPDERVDFQPDLWQRKVLDGIDANRSLFVVAPTSAGKTFISFYAMRKVLEADDDGILVYIAPTKALVNQIAAEIQARYSKRFRHGGKSVWAIHTRDYRINNPTGCQVLVTVPHVLQIMLLAPSNADSWSSRVKQIIFDEVHSIGQAEDGVVWEQLLLLAPCPIIALSATVGNPAEFSDWLSTTQKAIGIDLLTVQWPHRYNDLRKYYYVPPKRFHFQGLPDATSFGTLGLEHAKGINHIHPVAALVDKSRGIPEDLALEPRDCFELWQLMKKHQTKDYPVPDTLNPAKALPAVPKKADVLQWEGNLKAILHQWIADDHSPYDNLLHDLEKSFRDAQRESLQTTHAATDESARASKSIDQELTSTTLPMLSKLHEEGALPAILFNYDRHMCEKICRALIEQLVEAEKIQQKSGPKWQSKLERWEEWKKVQEKSAAKKSKVSSKKSKSKEDHDDDDKTSKLDQQRDAAGDVSEWDAFDPDAPIRDYHFANYARVQLSEMEMYTRQLRRREVQPWLIDGLRRGIGIHHAGMNRKYRQVVEILFRKGFLRVVIATGTLALGINMPCKTVVFSGDSVFLTALNFRQCAGRAGRRGFDLLGNVVFQGISREKVCRLISSRLPDLNGHFPITTTLVLRLFTLLTESKNSKYAVSAINALLSQPRLYMGGPSYKDQTMHHLRFSIEYLRRQCLLGLNGAPLNFAGLVSHLYFTENSSFAFHALLKEGYFHELCGKIHQNENNTLETLMLVLAHVFSRIYCRQSDEEYKETVVKPSSSIVFLPPLPSKASKILREHNRQTLQVYTKYADTFSTQHISDADNKMPLTSQIVGGEDEKAASSLHALPSTRVRSAFVALSGAGDEFDSISDLCQTARHGIFLEEAVVPHVQLAPEETEQPLNAWLLDFFKHGDVRTIEEANGIRRSDIWFLLNDFSLVLATIIASMMNFMKLKEGTDMDMLDIMGDLDAHEEAEDDKVADSEEQSEMSGPSVADSAIAIPDPPKQVTKKKAKNAESWEDVADEEDAMVASHIRGDGHESKVNGIDADGGAWEGEAGAKGLKDVLKAFTKLHAEFTVKFRAMWA